MNYSTIFSFATNNVLAVLNSTITIRTIMIPVIIQKLIFCTWLAQYHHHTRIVVACTMPRNPPAKTHWAPHGQPTLYLQYCLHLICTGLLYRLLLIWMENGKTSNQCKHQDDVLLKSNVTEWCMLLVVIMVKKNRLG